LASSGSMEKSLRTSSLVVTEAMSTDRSTTGIKICKQFQFEVTNSKKDKVGIRTSWIALLIAT